MEGIRPDKLLTEVASQLYRRNGEADHVLLQYLCQGSLRTHIRFPALPLTPYPVHPEFWTKFDANKFKLRRRRNGRWKHYSVEVPLTTFVDAAEVEIKGLISAAFEKRPDALAEQTLRRWLPNFEAPIPEVADEWRDLHASLIDRLATVSSMKNEKSRVYVSADEWDRFFSSVAKPPKHPGGRPPTRDSDQFWLELIKRVKPTKPDGLQKELIGALLVWAEANAAEFKIGGESWVKIRVQQLYQQLGWTTDTEN